MRLLAVFLSQFQAEQRWWWWQSWFNVCCDHVSKTWDKRRMRLTYLRDKVQPRFHRNVWEWHLSSDIPFWEFLWAVLALWGDDSREPTFFCYLDDFEGKISPNPWFKNVHDRLPPELNKWSLVTQLLILFCSQTQTFAIYLVLNAFSNICPSVWGDD